MDNLLDLDELAMVTGRSPARIKRDIKRHPACVLAHLDLSGTRLLRWRPTDVEVSMMLADSRRNTNPLNSFHLTWADWSK